MVMSDKFRGLFACPSPWNKSQDELHILKFPNTVAEREHWHTAPEP